MNIYHIISNIGVTDEMSTTRQKQVVASNRIAILLFFLGLGLMVRAVDPVLLWAKFYPLLLLFLSVPILNYCGYTYFSRVFFTFTHSLYSFLCPIFLTLYHDHPPQEYQILSDSIILCVLVVPILTILDPYTEKKAFYTILTISGLIQILLDPVSEYFGAGMMSTPNPIDRYYIYGTVRITCWVGIVLAVLFIRNINHLYEKKLIKVNDLQRKNNKKLEKQKNEILTQNEELRQSQEEILSQREFIEKVNKDLKEKEEFVTKSINSAFKIQNAVLPYKAKLDRILKDYFIIYRPKDIVSGDFFWLNKVEDQNILVVADCTGHGVSGAFMTLIGNTLLDKIIRTWKILSPNEILNRINEEIFNTLSQGEQNDNNSMDMSVINWKESPNNPDEYLLSYAGAKINMYVIDSSGIEVIKAERRNVGGVSNHDYDFSNVYERTVKKGTQILVTTDGLIDQNNNNRKRMGSRFLKQWVNKSKDLPMSSQLDVLNEKLDQYSQGTGQRDDICVVSFKI